MEENKNLVTEVTENVEITTEESPKNYTEAEFNDRVNEKVKELMGSKLARREAKIRKEFERKYGDLENVLKAGTGKESVEEMTDTFADFYESKGIKINRNRPQDYAPKDIEVLAKADAEDIIGLGYDEVVEEVDRLAEIGVENMTAREQAVFKALAKYRSDTERHNELSKIGVTDDVYNSEEFQNYAKLYKESTPISVIWDNYNKSQPKKEFKSMGSMTNKASDEGTVKDFYTRDEALKFTKKDFDKNPALFKAVEASMLKW